MFYELIIIGAGPAGISMAVEAIRSGIDAEKVILIEKSHEHSFSIRKFYPDQKLVTANYKGVAAVCNGVMCISDSSKHETLSYLDKAIEDYNIHVNYQEAVWKLNKQEDGSFLVATDKGEYRASVCAIAIGMMGKPNRPSYPIPSEVRSQVHFDITSSDFSKKQDILVVGGGDSASEYVQYLHQEGNNLSISYRRDDFTRMNDINRSSLLCLGNNGEVNIMLSSNVIGLEGKGEKVLVKFEDETEKEYDRVVLALGGSTPKNFLQLLGIEFNGDQPVIKEGYETSLPGLFLIGDLSAGKKGGSIISAFNSAHDAMKKICDDYLVCEIKGPWIS